MAKFVVLYNGDHLKTYELDEPVITIGRLPENSISIANMGVSRRHCRIEEDQDHRYMITDLNSLNGTYVNGQKIKKVNLNNNDKISIGKHTIIYNDESGVQEPAQELLAQTPEPQAELIDSDNAAGKNISDTRTSVPRDSLVSNTAAVSDDNAMAVLVETGKHVVYKLNKPYTTLGNCESDDIFVTGFMIGKAHACIECREDGIYLTALKMIGKLKVNGKTVKTVQLNHKDKIEIGAHTFRFLENG